MKINDKHLCSLAVGSVPIDKQGFLLKRGEQNKSFQKRWFVLKGNLLFYFEKPTDRDPIGIVILQNCIVHLSENEDAYAFELEFEDTACRSYVLAAETQEEMEDWMRAIASSSYDFMRLKVKELCQKLEELNVEQRKVAPCAGTGSASNSSVPSTLEQPASLLPLAGSVQPDLFFFEAANSGPSGSSDSCSVAGSCRKANEQPRSFEEMHRDFGKGIQETVKGGAVYSPKF